MRTGTVSELLKLSTVSAVATDEANHKKFSVRCQPTDQCRGPRHLNSFLILVDKGFVSIQKTKYRYCL